MNLPEFRPRSRDLWRLAACLALLGTAGSGLAAEREYVYRTVAGDTLIGIAGRFLVDPSDWRTLEKRNRIANPRAIPVGTAIRIPVERMRSEPRPVEVESVRGGAASATGSLAPGQRLAEGDQVATGEDGFVTLRLVDGTRVRVPSGSKVALERSRSYGGATIAETVVRLLGGRLDTEVKPQGAGDQFKVRTNRSVTAVRGTQFRVALLDEGAVATEVIEGRVGVNEERVEGSVEVSGGFGTKVEAGRPPLPPLRLLGAPDAARVPTLVERTLVRIPFGAVDGAKSYRAQIGLDAQFRDTVAEGRFDSPEAKFAGLGDGDYFVRLRAVDGVGLEGLDTVRPFRLKARPEPPFIAGPRDKAKSSAPDAKLAWSTSTEASSYHLQVSDRPDFATRVIDETRLAATTLDAGARVGKGNWHWRVASVRPDGDRGPWSDPRSFTVVPEAPAPKSGKGEDGRLTFEWNGEPGQRYQFQLASDAAFTQAIVDRLVDTPAIAFDEPPSGEYFFRVRAVDADGFQGPFGAAQRLEVSPSPWWLLLLLLLFAI